MVRLTKEQLKQKIDFINGYVSASNASTASTMDANANVTSKNIVTLSSELNKDITIQVNRELVTQFMGKKTGEQYIKDLESHLIYTHDESSLMPYCVSVNMWPFITDGMVGLSSSGGSEAPKHLRSFCGGFVNLVQYIASQFAGAVATVEFLMYFDHFARIDFGEDYLNTHKDIVEQELQGVVYLLNQDSSARGGQSVFWNISTYDEGFFEGIFGNFTFPDFDKPTWKRMDAIQRLFHEWFRNERKTKLLTFPVVTQASLGTNGEMSDRATHKWLAEEFASGGEFFVYTSESADSLASCCRLKNEVDVTQEFSFSLGAGGVATGSKNVITLNMNRLTQTGEHLEDVIARMHLYQLGFEKLYEWQQRNKLLPVFDAGYISLNKQFLTLGINGLLESAEFLGLKPGNNKDYLGYIESVVSTFKKMNKTAGVEYGVKFNTEIVPAENLGVKNAKWDRADGLVVNRDCYNSYFYIVEDNDNILDRMIMHGSQIVGNLDGGSAFHDNRDERLDAKQYGLLLDNLVKTGCNYYCENVPSTICNACGHIQKNKVSSCEVCASEDIDFATRVIGYLKRVKNFSEARQTEEGTRSYGTEVLS